MRLLSRPGLLVVATLIASAADVHAQEFVPRPVVPDSGEEVRVVQRGARGAVHGYWVEATDTDIVLHSIPGSGPIHIPREEITGMSVQRGQRHRTLAGALYGIGVGLATGVVLGQATDTFDGTGIAVGVSVGAALPLGMLVGWLIRSPEWVGIDMGVLPIGSR